jgi:hypothetical protein
MNTSLIKTANAILTGKNGATRSLSQLHKEIQKLAEHESEMIIICDCSGSMGEQIAGGQRRIDILRDAVKETRGKIISFSDRAEFTAAPRAPSGDTNYAFALNFAAPHAKNKRVVFISDGEPRDEEGAYEAAKKFPAKIETIFCGNPGSDGERVLKELARLTGGTHVATIAWDKPQIVSQKISGLLTA